MNSVNANFRFIKSSDLVQCLLVSLKRFKIKIGDVYIYGASAVTCIYIMQRDYTDWQSLFLQNSAFNSVLEYIKYRATRLVDAIGFLLFRFVCSSPIREILFLI